MAYERKETYSLEEIFPHVYSPRECRKNKDLKYHVFDGDEIKMISARYRLFKYTGCKCVNCSTVGTFFAKERPEGSNERYHLNLYGYDKDGNEVMLTKDHIRPKAKGGRDTLMNYQTMCIPCNQLKKDEWDGLSGC